MVRHPLRRIESAWAQLLSVGDANRFIGFERTLYETETLIDASLYWKQLSEYRRYFPDEQIKIGVFEEFVTDERAELRACLEFLGIEPCADIYVEDDEARNESVGKRQRLVAADAVRVDARLRADKALHSTGR